MSGPVRSHDRAPAQPTAQIHGWRLVLVWVAIGLAATALLGWATPFGLGLRDDSFTYLSAAETMAASGRYGRMAGDGTMKPVTNFPPLYSATLAGVSPFSADVAVAARSLHQLLLAVLVVLSGVTVYRATASAPASVLAALLTGTADLLLQTGSWALSELLFLCLASAGIVLLSEHLRVPRRATLFLAAFVFALMMLTRYAGLPFVAAGVLCLWWLVRPGARRWRDALVFAAIALLPVGLFLLRNLTLTGNVVNRPTPYWHPPAMDRLLAGAQTIVRWILPERLLAAVPDGAVLVAALAMGAALALAVTRYLSVSRPEEPQVDPRARPLVVLLSLSLVAYIAFLLASLYLLDVLTPLNDRLLSPLYLEAMLLVVVLGQVYWKRWGPLHKTLAVAGCLLLLSIQGYRMVFAAQGLRGDGQGYAGRQWRESRLLTAVCRLPDVPIYSNDLPAIYFRCGRMALALPSAVNLASGLPNPDFQAEVDSMMADVRESGGLVVFVGWYGPERVDRTGFSELASQLTLTQTFEDGLIYAK
jgi:hypothetical protein